MVMVVDQAATFWQIKYFHVTLSVVISSFRGLINPHKLFLKEMARGAMAFISDEFICLDDSIKLLNRPLLQYKLVAKP
ncbi:hypothetical protein KEJ14_03545 [Candidatus Bathyarchaeota archaeon]|nr:hypothetical protein [Candidatus Bathyarchaeota archaeon]